MTEGRIPGSGGVHPEILFNAGLLEQKAQNHQEAVKFYTQAISHKTEFAEAHLNLAIAYQSLGNDAEANQSFERAIRLKPELPKGYFALVPPGVSLFNDSLKLRTLGN